METTEELLARIADLEQRNAQLEALVTTDPLTGLRNRRGFDEALTKAVAQAARDGQSIAVLVLDGNGLKRINDELGHEAGDAAIVHIAGALRACLRSADTPARFGGDEFAVILHGASMRSASVAATRILAWLRANPMPWGATTRLVTVCIGGASSTKAQTDGGRALFLRADELLVKHAKPLDRVNGIAVVEWLA